MNQDRNGKYWTQFVALLFSAWFLKKGQELAWSAAVFGYANLMEQEYDGIDLYAIVLVFTFAVSLILMRALVYAYDRFGKDVFRIEQIKGEEAREALGPLQRILQWFMYLWTLALFDGAMITLAMRKREHAFKGLNGFEWLVLVAATLYYSVILTVQSLGLIWLMANAEMIFWKTVDIVGIVLVSSLEIITVAIGYFALFFLWWL